MNPRIIDLTGQTFGRLTVIRLWGRKNKEHRVHWLCQCDCGNTMVVASNHLRNKLRPTISCNGEVHRKYFRCGLGSDGKRPLLYVRWCGMHARCENKNHASYKHYGGRGIKVCDRWSQFENFYDDMAGSFKAGMTIERKDNNGSYCPENCVWADQVTQSNNMRSNRLLTFKGITQSMAKWAKLLGLNSSVLHYRLACGYPLHKALSRGSFRNASPFR